MALNYIPGSINISNYDGKVGIGTLNPLQTLDINGNINSNSNISCSGTLNSTFLICSSGSFSNLNLNSLDINGDLYCTGTLNSISINSSSGSFSNISSDFLDVNINLEAMNGVFTTLITTDTVFIGDPAVNIGSIKFNSGSSTGFYVNKINTNSTTVSNILSYNNGQITQESNFSYVPSSTGYIINTNLIPSNEATWDLGTYNKPWKSIYVSTGSVFIGPTGSLLINNNGLIASEYGFAAPYVQVGSTNPGNGIVLENVNNTLYFVDQFGSSGPVSIWRTASNGLNNTYFTGGNLGIGTSNPIYPLDIYGDIHSTTKVVIGNTNTGSIAFEKDGQTGCFISPLRYDATGNHYVYYNSYNNELIQSSPSYFFIADTGTQTFATTNTYYPVTFSQNIVLYNNWQHTPGSSILTGTFNTPCTLNIGYNIQVDSTVNQNHTIAAAIYIDGAPVLGSYRSLTVLDTIGEGINCNNILYKMPSGSHTLELRAAVDNTSVTIGGTPNIPAPTGSYTSVSMTCNKII